MYKIRTSPIAFPDTVSGIVDMYLSKNPDETPYALGRFLELLTNKGIISPEEAMNVVGFDVYSVIKEEPPAKEVDHVDSNCSGCPDDSE